MKEYHICYELKKSELCTGYNIIAKSYIDALEKFKNNFKNKNIIYVTEKKQ